MLTEKKVSIIYPVMATGFFLICHAAPLVADQNTPLTDVFFDNGSYAGWHTLVLTVTENKVNYYVDAKALSKSATKWLLKYPCRSALTYGLCQKVPLTQMTRLNQTRSDNSIKKI